MMTMRRHDTEAAMENNQAETEPGWVNVFFYGLFMDADSLRANGFHPHSERQACVRGMALRIGERATLVPNSSESVHGFVMCFSRVEIDRLYAEPSVATYRPEVVRALLTSGETVQALCFNLPIGLDQRERNPDYATKLRELGRRLGLPDQYVESIR